jgi:hypothetical protein
MHKSLIFVAILTSVWAVPAAARDGRSPSAAEIREEVNQSRSSVIRDFDEMVRRLPAYQQLDGATGFAGGADSFPIKSVTR